MLTNTSQITSLASNDSGGRAGIRRQHVVTRHFAELCQGFAGTPVLVFHLADGLRAVPNGAWA